MRVRPCADWRGSNCGLSDFRSLSRFHTTALASKAEPSWKVTPGRSVKIQRVLSAGSTFHEVARPGTRSEALSDRLRSQLMSASYTV
jgi:hypothetical protein